MSRAPITQTSVHPLVLLSIVDHFNRVNPSKQRNKRVVGALLGTTKSTQDPSTTRKWRLLTVTLFPLRRIQVNQVFGFSITSIMKLCLI